MDKLGMDSVQTSLLVRLLLVLMSVGVAIAQTNHINETCSRGATPCTSLVGHVASGNQSLTDIGKLYGVTVPSLLGSNNVDLTETSVTTKLVPQGKVVQVRQRCSCINQTRVVNSTSYAVALGDTLSYIAEQRFSNLITYQEIAAANGISNPDDIKAGEKFVIPFPCACENNTFEGQPAVFLTYVIQNGDALENIAATYGTTVEVLSGENGIQNVTNIFATDRIEIPLTACFSQFNSKATDYNLLVPNGTYILSPGAGCVQSFCYGSSRLPKLHSFAAPDWNGTSTCPSLKCSNGLPLGNITTSQAGDICTVTECAYEGYANSTTIYKKLHVTNETTCPVVTAAPPEQQIETVPSPPGAGAPAPIEPAPAPSSAVKVGGALLQSSITIAVSICLVLMEVPFLGRM